MPLTPFIRLVSVSLFLLMGYASRAQNESFFMTPVGPNHLLDTPWDLDYGPDGYLWVTERKAGVVLRVNPVTAERDELIQIPEVSSTAGQDGLLGMALQEGLLDGNPYVYLSYTHLVQGQRKQKLVRYTYAVNGDDGALSAPVTLLDNLPASNDHNSGRLVFGPDGKLYYTIGDQGNNQNSNYCRPILSQFLPTQEEVDQQDWTNYPGKVLRLNTDGSIPTDNPILAGVQSHIYSYGHRNAQGLIFGSNGSLYADEHGPNSDDEVNMIQAGKNYGWPNVVGYQDDQLYDYCNWSSAANCASLNYSYTSCPPNATFLEESSFAAANYQDPLFALFAVTDDYNYNNPACDNAWICRPNVAPSSIAIYENEAIPSWQNSLLIVSLKRGRVYRLKLDEDGTAVVGDTTQLFYTQNRYRDLVVAPDGKSFFLITDQTGNTAGPSGLTVTNNLQNPGAILKFTLQEPVAVGDQAQEPFLRIWPNPVAQVLHIELKPDSESDCRAELINAAGQVVCTVTNLQPGLNELRVADFPAGVYFLRLYSKTHSWQQRVVHY